ncbi:HtaA domain-containing protein [Leucobacter sp. GX24907]
MAAHTTGIRAGVSALIATALAASGLLLTAPVAHAEEPDATPTLTAEVTEFPGERIVIETDGAGYTEALAATGEVRLGIVEQGGAPSTENAVLASVDADGRLRAPAEPLERAVSELDENVQYEVVSWASDAEPIAQNTYARAAADIDWNLLVPQTEDASDGTGNDEEPAAEPTEPNDDSAGEGDAADAQAPQRAATAKQQARAAQAAGPSISVDATEVADEKVTLGVTGSGYDDVQALPGQSEPHAYLAVVPRGTNVDGLEQGDMLGEVSVSIQPDGTFTTADLSSAWEIVASDLDRTKEYEAISWPSRSNPTAATLYTRADIEIDWDVLYPCVANGESPVVCATVTEVPNDKITIEVIGSGYEDVQALPGQSEPHAYLAVVPKDTDIDGLEQGDMLGEVSASIRPDGTFTTSDLSAAWEVAASDLDRAVDYEIISWPSRSNPTEVTLYTRADIEIDWHKLFPEDAPRITEAKVAGADSKTGLTVRVAAENITFPADEKVSGVTVAMVQRGTKVSDSTDAVRVKNISMGEISDGEFVTTLQAPKSRLDRYENYDVVIYPNTGFASQIASSRLTITAADWTKLFGKALPATVTVDKVSVGKTGLNVTVSAKDLPGSNLYVAVLERGKESELSQDGGYMESGFLYQPPVKNGKGTFKFTLSKNDLNRNKVYEVLIWKSHSNPDASTIYGRADINISERQWDALANTTPAKKKENKPKPVSRGGSAQAGSLTWGISSGFADYTTNKKRAGGKSGGKILTSGVGGGRGGWVFPQASGGSWNKSSQTGTVRYSGVVIFTAHKGLMNESFSNPVITVSNSSSGTISSGGRSFRLDLASANKSVGANGEVTWSNVPVAGSISGGGTGGGGSIPVDPLSFTVGSASKVSYGSTADGAPEKPQRTAAATPPARDGITVLTDAEKITAGGRIQLESAGFDPEDEGVLVVLYEDVDETEPIVLDEEATADESGRVEWSGTLPKDVTGDYVITMQGSIDTGAELDILKKRDKTSAKTAEAKRGVQAVAEDEAVAAGIIPGTGMALWEWWLAAGGLVAIAASTSLLAMRQRRG